MPNKITNALSWAIVAAKLALFATVIIGGWLLYARHCEYRRQIARDEAAARWSVKMVEFLNSTDPVERTALAREIQAESAQYGGIYAGRATYLDKLIPATQNAGLGIPAPLQESRVVADAE